jgi:hypothetical protein
VIERFFLAIDQWRGAALPFVHTFMLRSPLISPCRHSLTLVSCIPTAESPSELRTQDSES